MYTGPSQSRREPESLGHPANPGRMSSSTASASPQANGNKSVDFVSEDDVKRAIQKGEKIYINAKTIITPAARDIGEPAEVFAKS